MPIAGSSFSEALTPLVLAMQKQFNFSHVLAGATASGKVSCLKCCYIFIQL